MEEKIMEPSSFLDISKQIVEANGDQGKITSLLTQLQEGYEGLYSSHVTTISDRDKLKEENASLKQYNFDLFMKRGVQMQQEQETTKESQKARAETITTKDLFKKEEK